MNKRPILKNSLLALYRDSDEITEALNLIDFTAVHHKFYKEIFHHIDEELFWKVDDYLNGDDVLVYHNAVDKAAVACTSDIAALIELALSAKDVKH